VWHFGFKKMSSITLENIALSYPLVGMGNRSLKSRILGVATGGLVTPPEAIPIIHALKDISLNLKDGDRLGLVGHNGAGKSSLLKVLAGIYRPTSGILEVEGRVVSTLNISLGMEVEATGYENIYIRGLMLGMSLKEISKKITEIAGFTELGKYLDLPVRFYSSGMKTRLAFATVTAMDSDILLMDEVIGTGDASFIGRAEARLNEFINRSKIIVLASHSDEMILRLCNKAILLEHGKLINFAAPHIILDQYHSRVVMRVGA
jgi:ABC-2 type transport system ATP-binding protein/lipopolysaccharide transport system ATP-binding protein